MIETFEAAPETRWGFFTDGVMGGVSYGQAAVMEEDEAAFARMTGRVSTDNNGGFIQMRMGLPQGVPGEVSGVRLIVRGNDEAYFVHLRTGATQRPWHYFQAAFDVTGEWTEVRLPLTEFKEAGRSGAGPLTGADLRSIAVVAYGRDHDAAIDVQEIGFY